MATYIITHKTEQNIPVEVTFPSWYKQGENEFIFFKSPNEVVRIDCDTRLRFYNVMYTGFLSPDNIQHFVVSGRKSSQTEFMEAYHVVQDVLRDAFVSYKHLDKTLEALELEYTQPDYDSAGADEYMQPRNEEPDDIPEALGITREQWNKIPYTNDPAPRTLGEYLVTVLQKDDNL